MDASHSALPWIGTRTMVVCVCRAPAGRAPKHCLPGTEDSALESLLVYIDHSVVRPGKAAELIAAVSALVQFVEQREPQLLSYAFHVDPEAMTMSVVAVHPDPASLKLHLELGGPEFLKVGKFIDLRLIEVYGEPGSAVRALLEQKAMMLGKDARVVVRPRSVGFARS